MRAVVLFGAGASAFCGQVAPQCPPLGHELFPRLLEEGGAARELPVHVQREFEGSFEVGMLAALAQQDEKGRLALALVRQAAVHLAKYRLMEGKPSSYTVLCRRIAPVIHRIALASLNYDTLLEQALAQEGLDVRYRSGRCEVGTATVLKVHGSVNFLPVLPPGWKLTGNQVSGEMLRNGRWIKDINMQPPSLDPRAVADWCADEANQDLTPVMSFYAPGKHSAVNNPLIDRAKREFVAELGAARVVVLIGVRFVEGDQHLWEPLRACEAKVLVVDPQPGEALEWLNSVRRRRAASQLTSSFEDVETIAAVVLSSCR